MLIYSSDLDLDLCAQEYKGYIDEENVLKYGAVELSSQFIRPWVNLCYMHETSPCWNIMHKFGA